MEKKISKIFKKIINYFKYNKQFCSFVILSILCSIYVRYYTSGNFSAKPIIFDIALPIIIGSFAYLWKPKKQFKYLFTCLIIMSVMCVIHSIYYEFYSSYASVSLLTTLGQATTVTDAVFEKLKITQFVYLLTPIIFVIINKRLNNKDYFNFVSKFEKSKKLFGYVLIIGLAIFVLGAITLTKTDYSRLAKQWNREYVVNRFGIIIYQINDFVNTLSPTINSWFGYDVAYKNFTLYYEENGIKKSNNEYTNKFKGYNVIFVHMESITTFLLDLNVNGLDIAPNITTLSQEGLYFKNFYPQISVGTSSDSEFTLSSSLMPATHGTVFVSYFDRDYPTIQKILKSNDYYTFSMHGNKASMWNRSTMYPYLGYMDYYSSTSFDIDEVVGLGLSDKSFFKQVMPILENIEKNNERYMGTIITLSNHTPFANNQDIFEQIKLDYTTERLNGETGDTEKITYSYLDGTKLGDYIRSAHYADEALGEFISYVKESDYFDNTLFVFYGDHDPKLSLKEFYNYYNFDFETGEILTDASDNYVNYDYYANELNRKTPLIMWTKNKKLSQQVDYYMGMIDVAPTVLNMLGYFNEYALGHDIFEIKDNNIIAFPNGNFLTNKVYYRSSKEEYKPLTTDDVLSDEYINSCKEYADKIIDISDGIITHDLIKASKNKETVEEIK